MPLYSIQNHPTWSYTEGEKQQMIALDAASAQLKMRLERIRSDHNTQPYRYDNLTEKQEGFLRGYEAAYSAIQHLNGETGFAFYGAAGRRAQSNV